MVKAIIFIGACAIAGSIVAQPNNSNFNNSNLSNVFVSNNNNINIQQAVNINVQQSLNVNKPKTVRQTRRRTVSTTTPKPSSVNTQAAVRRPTRTRRPSTHTNTNASNVAQVQVAPIQVANDDNVNVANVINTQEFVAQEPQQQVLFTNINPVQTNKQYKNEDNVDDNQGISIDFPTFKKPQIYFSYADLSVTHKSVSLKKMISKKMLKASRKHKAKHSGRIKRYITHNCCKWN